MLPLMARVLSAGVLVLTLSAAHATDAVVYVRSGGNDQASGSSESEAVGTLQAAVRKVLAQKPAGLTARRVVVLPGTYLEQVTIVRDLPDEVPLVITAAAGTRPVFDGNGKGRSWLVLQSATGKPSRLTVQGLEISNYVTAVSLNGERTSINASNGQNVLRDNVFRNIGQVAFPSGKPATAAVRLVNSRNNQIVQNHFINIRNITGCTALHSIYMAHYSSGNLIQGNVFDGGCGATIKTRDASNENLIRDNRFIDQAEAVFLDSFCDQDSRDDCTKAENECPSWDNRFENNSMSRLAAKVRKMPVRAAGSDAPSGCVPPPTRRGRLTQANNRLDR
jgi:hypothetical protein